MTIATDREDLALVLEGVPGVNGHAYKPSAPAEGDAWPRLVSIVREQGIVLRPTWAILVWLSSDERVASAWIDEHFADLVEALSADASPGFVDEGEPALMQVGRNDHPMLEITLKTVG